MAKNDVFQHGSVRHLYLTRKLC